MTQLEWERQTAAFIRRLVDLRERGVISPELCAEIDAAVSVVMEYPTAIAMRALARCEELERQLAAAEASAAEARRQAAEAAALGERVAELSSRRLHPDAAAGAAAGSEN